MYICCIGSFFLSWKLISEFLLAISKCVYFTGMVFIYISTLVKILDKIWSEKELVEVLVWV